MKSAENIFNKTKHSPREYSGIKNILNGQYNISYLLSHEQIQVGALLKISEKLDISISEAAKQYYIDGVSLVYELGQEPDMSSDAMKLYFGQSIDNAVNAAKKGKPAFLSLDNGKHFVLAALVPDHNNPNKLSVVYINSMPEHLPEYKEHPFAPTGKKFADSLLKYIAANKNKFKIELSNTDVLDMSREQQLANCCGLSVASNIASVALHVSQNKPASKIVDSLFAPTNVKEKTDYYQAYGEELFTALDNTNLDLNMIYGKKDIKLVVRQQSIIQQVAQEEEADKKKKNELYQPPEPPVIMQQVVQEKLADKKEEKEKLADKEEEKKPELPEGHSSSYNQAKQLIRESQTSEMLYHYASSVKDLAFSAISIPFMIPRLGIGALSVFASVVTSPLAFCTNLPKTCFTFGCDIVVNGLKANKENFSNLFEDLLKSAFHTIYSPVYYGATSIENFAWTTVNLAKTIPNLLSGIARQGIASSEAYKPALTNLKNTVTNGASMIATAGLGYLHFLPVDFLIKKYTGYSIINSVYSHLPKMPHGASFNSTIAQAQNIALNNAPNLAYLCVSLIAGKHFYNNIITLLNTHNDSNKNKTELGAEVSNIVGVIPVITLNALAATSLLLAPVITTINPFSLAILATSSLIVEASQRYTVKSYSNELKNLQKIADQYAEKGFEKGIDVCKTGLKGRPFSTKQMEEAITDYIIPSTTWREHVTKLNSSNEIAI